MHGNPPQLDLSRMLMDRRRSSALEQADGVGSSDNGVQQQKCEAPASRRVSAIKPIQTQPLKGVGAPAGSAKAFRAMHRMARRERAVRATVAVARAPQLLK